MDEHTAAARAGRGGMVSTGEWVPEPGLKALAITAIVLSVVLVATMVGYAGLRLWQYPRTAPGA